MFHTWTPDLGRRALQEALSHRGAVVFSGVRSAGSLLEHLGHLGAAYVHADSDASGLTHIASASDALVHRDAADTNKLGFTHEGLFPHTDRSGVPSPPRLLAFWCERQAPVGGSSLFVDGHQLFDDLSSASPAAIEVLTRPSSVVFKSERGLVESSVFTITHSRLSVRFRLDRMIYISPDVAGVLPLLKDSIKRLSLKQPLKDGEGYLIDNQRWLHGRTHYIGPRSAWRLLLSEG